MNEKVVYITGPLSDFKHWYLVFALNIQVFGVRWGKLSSEEVGITRRCLRVQYDY